MMTISGFFFGRKQNASNGRCTSCGKLRCGTVRTRTLSMEPLESRDLLSVTTSLLDADDAANVAAVISSSASSDNLTVELPAAGKTVLKSSYATPSGYNDNDYQKIVAFFELTDSDGVKNGTKVSKDYNPANLLPMTNISWKIVNNERRISKLIFANDSLVGSADFSGMTSLTSISCQMNQITSLNVSNCTSLTSLSCNENQLKTLNVSNCTKLTTLNCEQNQLTSLDVSNLSKLTTLTCFNNQLRSLNVSNCSGLTTLKCYQNQLTSLSFYSSPALTSLYCNDNKLTSLSASNCTALTLLNCYNNQLTSLNLSSCTALTELNCYSNQLTSLDISANTALKTLKCYSNQLTSLDISANTALKTLDCNNNQLTSLDASNHSALSCLYCHENQLTSLNLSGCTGLILTKSNDYSSHNIYSSYTPDLQIYDNVLEDINLSGCTGITYFTYTGTYSNHTQLKSLDVSGCTSLENLNCSYGRLTSLNLSGCSALTTLKCEYNELTSLDVSGVVTLKQLSCSFNQLAALDVSANMALTTIHCSYNQLLTLDVSNHTALRLFYCNDNLLTSLNMSGCTSLPSSLYINNDSNDNGLKIKNNTLEYLNISGCTGFTSCSYYTSSSTTKLKTLDASGCTSLTSLYCYYGQLTNLNVSGCTSLKTLMCSSNNLTSLDISTNTKLTTLDCNNNQLTSLDASNLKALTSLVCNKNQLTSLNISGCTSLALTISDNYYNKSSNYFNIKDNPLEYLNISGCTGITIFNYYGNSSSSTQLKTLLATGCTSLQTLCCHYGQITSLDISECTELEGLNFYSNPISSLDLATNVKLQHMTIDTSILSTVRLSYSSLNKLSINFPNSSYTLTNSQGSSTLGSSSYTPTGLPFTATSLTTGQNIIFDSKLHLVSLELSIDSLESGAVITALPTPSDAEVNYQWYCGSALIPDATGPTYTATQDQMDQVISCVATGMGNYNGTFGAKTNGERFFVTPNGYNNNDYQKMVAFLEQTDSDGVKNGTKLYFNYDPSNPSSWYNSSGSIGVKWTYIDGEMRISELNFYDKSLVGSADFSNMTYLTSLDCDYNQMTSLSVSDCSALSYLRCSFNPMTSLNLSNCSALSYLESAYDQFTSLDISDCTALSTLYCSYNQLTSLNISSCNALTFLDCTSNQLTSLDVSNCMELTTLKCSSNQLTSLDVSNHTKLTSLSCVSDSLETLNISGCAALPSFSYVGDSSSYANLKTLDASGCTSLQNISCLDSQLTSLNVSNCTTLAYITIFNCPLKSLDISGCTAITSYTYKGKESSYTTLETLNASGCTALKELYCYYGQLKSLNLSGCTALLHLYCDNNQLTSLDVSDCTELQWLGCGYNQLSSLDVSNHVNLTSLSCKSNTLKTINISGCTSLTEFSCSGESSSARSNVQSLNASGCTSLQTLYCYYNQLTSLDVSGCTALTTLECQYNNLSSLNVSGSKSLTTLWCSYNQLASLDVSGCVKLTSFSYSSNPLETINISGCTSLTSFYYNSSTSSPSHLKTLNASKCTSLTSLECSNGPLSYLDISGCTGLTNFSYNGSSSSPTQLTTLNAAGCTSLQTLSCRYGQLTSLNVSGCTALVSLVCDSNLMSSLNLIDNANLQYLTIGDSYLSTVRLFGLYYNYLNISFVNSSYTITNSQGTYNVSASSYYKPTTLPFTATSNATGKNIVFDRVFHLTEMTLSDNSPKVGSVITASLTPSDVSADYQWYCGTTIINGATESSLTVTADMYDQTITCVAIGTGEYVGTVSAETTGVVQFAAPDEYFDDDYQKMIAFLEQTDSDGVKNGTKLNANYNPADPVTWTGVSWTTVDNKKRVSTLNIASKSLVGSADFSNMTSLSFLHCGWNQLASLDVSGCAALSSFNCGTNQLSSLDVSDCASLMSLTCDTNQLTSLDVSKNIELSYLQCNANQLTTLDLSKNTKLTSLTIGDSHLTSVRLSNEHINKLNICFYDSSYTVTNSQGAFSASSNYLPTELPFTATSATTGNTITFDALFHLSDLTLSTDSPLVGAVINASIEPSDATVEYQWYCGTTPIEGATGSSFTITAEQYGKTITCIATGIGNYTTSVSATTANPATYATPDGYNDNDFQKMLAFLEQADSNGVKNGTKANSNYNPANPLTWNVVRWITYSSQKRIESVTFNQIDVVGSADLSNMTRLFMLKCYSNHMTSLDVSGCSYLSYLDCYSDQLTSLNVSGCTSLSHFNCSYNMLTSLDVADCTKLSDFSCVSNQLTSLDASGITTLTTLICDNNPLTSLNVSGCASLKSLSCENNLMTSLDLSNYINLTSLSCNSETLESLNISGCTALTSFSYKGSASSLLNLKTLDASGCTSLQTLTCNYNPLTSLNVSNCTALTALYCNNNQLTSLNVSGCASLTTLQCDNNQLTSLNLSGFTELYNLNCSFNQLKELDVSGCVKLSFDIFSYFEINNNPLETLNISGCTSFTSYSYNQVLYTPYQLKTLLASGCTSLETIDFINAQLTTLDVSGCTKLNKLTCSNNSLTSLNVSGCTALTQLICPNNQLTSLDFSDCISLTFINCSLNQLASLDVSNNTALATLFCYSNQLTSLDVSKNSALRSLSCYSNQLTSLDIADNANLTSLSIGDSYLSSVRLSNESVNTIVINFYNSLYYITNSHGTNPVSESRSYKPTELPFTAASSTTGKTILFDNKFHLAGLTLSTDDPVVGSAITASVVPSEATADYQWYSGTTLIEGATDSTFIVTENQYGQTLTCVATGTGIYTETLTATTSKAVLYATPFGYNDHDYQKMVAFLEQTDSNGVKNGRKLNSYYDPEDPSTWSGISWTFVNDEKRISDMIIISRSLIGSADFSNMVSLTRFIGYYNQLTSLDVSQCTALTELNCGSNELTFLNVSGCTALAYIHCDTNRLTSLDLSGFTALNHLHCYSNQLTSLNVSGCTRLKLLSIGNYYNVSANNDFRIENNPIENLNLSGCTGITTFTYTGSSTLKTLDVSGCTALNALNCYNNQLTSLNVSGCTKLNSLGCYSNQLPSLDVSKNTALTSLNCSSNQLPSLDVTKNTALTSLNCSSNQLPSLDVTKNAALTSLDCSSNQLTSLDVFFNAQLTSLGIGNNAYLTTVCLSKQAINKNNIRLNGSWVVETNSGDVSIISNNFTPAELPFVATNASNTQTISFVSMSTPSLESLTVYQNQITASWSAVKNASHYTLEYQLDGESDWISIDNIEGTTASFIGVYGNKYNVRVKACGDSVHSDSFYSEISSITIKYPITGLTLSTLAPESGNIITALLSPEGATADYQWYCGNKLLVGATGSSYTVSANQIGQTITCIATGTGNYVGSVSATTAPVSAIVLETPSIDGLSSNGIIINVSWTKVNNASSYTIEYKLDGDDVWTVNSGFQNESMSFTGDVGKTYNVRVKAIGIGDYADSEYSPTQTIAIDDTLDAQNDFVKTKLNIPVVIDYRDNDDATDWSVVTVQFGDASHGEYVVNEDETISYTPESGFFGTETIGYSLFSPSGKASVGSIVISVGLPIATSVQKTVSVHTPSSAMAPSVDSLTDWDNCCVELWAQGVNELNSGETTVTLKYNPAVYEVPYFSACAEGVVLSASEGVVLPNGNVEIQLTVQVLEPIESLTDNLYLGTVVLTPSGEEGSGVEDGSNVSACVLEGVELTTSVETMPYDMNHNGTIDVNDFISFATVFGTNLETMSPDNPLYAQAVKADFNKDGIVDVDDFIAFSINFGATKKTAAKPIPQASAAVEAGNREWEVGNGEDIDSPVEPPVAQSATPASQLVTRNSQLEVESSMTLLEAYSAALLDLYDNQESFDQTDPGAVLVESRMESPVASYSEDSSQNTPFDVVDAVLEENLLAIDWE